MKDIFIVSRKRADTPITWNAFPDKYKERTQFVVWEDDAQDYISAFGKEHVEVIPLKYIEEKDIHLGSKRNYIYYKFMHPHMVFDDDLTISRRYTNPPEKRPPIFVQKYLTSDNVDHFDEFFDDMFNIPTKQPGYNWGGITYESVPPSLLFEEFRFGKVIGTYYFNRPVLPNNIDFARFPTAEDQYINLEFNLQGFPSGVYYKHVQSEKKGHAAPGGCNIYRTIESERRVCQDLKKAYPKYVKIRQKIQSSGKLKGQTRTTVIIYNKKAYNDYLKTNVKNKLIVT